MLHKVLENFRILISGYVDLVTEMLLETENQSITLTTDLFYAEPNGFRLKYNLRRNLVDTWYRDRLYSTPNLIRQP